MYDLSNSYLMLMVVLTSCEGVGCQPNDIDVSIAVFEKLADPNLGRVKVTWAWLPPIPAT